MKLFERLGLKPYFADFSGDFEGIEIAKKVNSAATDYERVWKKFKLPDCRHLLCLSCYYSDEHALVKSHAVQCIDEMGEFFFGEWRNTFVTPEKAVDPAWWKRRFIWMQLFEAAVLWGSVVSNWDFLKQIGNFPEADSCISDGYRAVDRDLYVAWGAFLAGLSPAELEPLFEKVQMGRSRACKLVLALLRAGVSRNQQALEKALVDWLRYYRKEEFPKEKVTKKISIEGTFFVHWAEKEGIPVVVPPEFADHIVRLV